MTPDKLGQVLKHEGVVAIATQGQDGPHLVNTWNSYVSIVDGEKLIIPAGYMNVTEENIERDPRILITMGSREVEGSHGPGTGFLVEGTASFETEGAAFASVKERFPWARAALVVTISSITQTL